MTDTHRGVSISSTTASHISMEKNSMEQKSHATQPSEGNTRNSIMSTAAMNEEESDTYRYTRFRLVWNFFSCKDLTLKQYRMLLFMTLLMNVMFFITEIIRIVYYSANIGRRDDDYKDRKDRSYIVTFIVATSLTFVNCLIILKLLYRPTPKTALASSAMTVCVQIISFIQCILYWQEVVGSTLNGLATFTFLILELFSAMLLYRYWEYAKFYYDDQAENPTNLLSDIITNYKEPEDDEFTEYSGRYSTAKQQPQQSQQQSQQPQQQQMQKGSNNHKSPTESSASAAVGGRSASNSKDVENGGQGHVLSPLQHT